MASLADGVKRASGGRLFGSPPWAMRVSISLAVITEGIRSNSGFRPSFQRFVKHLVHQGRIDGINRRGLLEWLRSLAAFDVTDRLANRAAQRVVNDQTRLGAQRDRRLRSARVVFAREGRDDEPASALEFGH